MLYRRERQLEEELAEAEELLRNHLMFLGMNVGEQPGNIWQTDVNNARHRLQRTRNNIREVIVNPSQVN